MATAQSVIDFLSSWRSQNQIGNGPLNATQLNQFVEELYQRLSTVDITPPNKPGATILPYTGRSGGTLGWQLAEGVTKGDSTRFYISETQAGALMSDPNFLDALQVATDDVQLAKDIRDGRMVNGVRTPFGIGDRLSVNDLLSQRVMQAASGDIVTITTEFEASKVFWATELPALLANENVTSINGIPRETLIALQAVGEDTLRQVVMTSSLMAGAELHVDRNGRRTSLFELNLSHDPQRVAEMLNSAQLRLTSSGLNLAGRLGLVGDVMDIGGTAIRAAALVRAGDRAAAAQLLRDFGVRTAGGWAAGEAAAALTASTLAPLAATGPWGVAGVMLLTAVAGIAGGIFGEQVIEDLLSDEEADPWDAKKGIQLASRDDATGLAFRRMLYFLDPMAVITEANNPVDLSLYNPQTHTGAITQEWIEARSKALTFYSMYWNRRETDGVLTTPLVLSLPGDLVISDAALGAAGELTVNGFDLDGTPARYWRFGDENENTLLGGTRDDRLFGDGGNDILIGNEGNDYLEGGEGSDTLITGAGSDVLHGGTGNDEYVITVDAARTTIRDTDGVGSIAIMQADGSRITLGGSVAVGSSGYFEDEDGNRYRRVGADLSITLAGSGRTILVEGFDTMPGARLGIDLQEPGGSTPTGKSYAVGAPNQQIEYPPIVNGDTTAFFAMVESIGLYTLGQWYSAGGYFARNDSEVITVSAAIHDPANGQSRYAAVNGGMGDSYITGDDRFNWIVDDNEGHFHDNAIPARTQWPVGLGGVGLYPISNNFALGIWGWNYTLSDDPGNDTIHAGGGSDVVVTHGGNDVVYGGDGTDVIFDTHGGAIARPNESFTYLGTTGTGVTHIYDFDSLEWINQEGHTSNDAFFGDAGDDYLAAHGGRQMMDGGADDDELFGGADNDVLIGGTGNDVLAGDLHLWQTPLSANYDQNGVLVQLFLEGNSLLSETVQYGADLLEGGEGNDTLIGGAGDDTLFGGEGDDYIDGDFSRQIVDPNIRSGIRNLEADSASLHGNDRIFAGHGNDTVAGGGGNDDIDGGIGNDTIFAGAGNDLVFGGDGADVIQGDDEGSAGGSDEIHGGDGGDTITGGAGEDRLFGDEGADTIHGDGGDAFGHDWIDGGQGNDHIYGDRGNDYLHGGGGYDEVFGGEGNDFLVAGTGNDRLEGGANSDTYLLAPGSGYVHINDTEGFNTLHFSPEVPMGAISLRRSGGLIYIQYGASDAAVMSEATFNTLQSLRIEDAVVFESTTLMTIEELLRRFIPSELTDVAVPLAAGVAAGSVAFAAQGDDLILSYGGAESAWVDLTAFAATDVQFAWRPASNFGITSPNQVLVLTNWYQANPSTYIHELAEANGTRVDFTSIVGSIERRWSLTESVDEFTGTSVRDVVFARAGADVISVGAGDDFVDAGDGNDEISGGTGNDSLRGLAGNDYLSGEEGDDNLDGGADDDVLSGGAGTDSLRGLDGNDRLHGGDGTDFMYGGAGTDELIGGSGNDRYNIELNGGFDTVIETDGATDYLVFGAGIAATDLTLTESADGILVRIGAAADGNSVLIRSQGPGVAGRSIEGFSFADGTFWNASMIDDRIAGNRAPELATPLADAVVGPGQFFSYIVPSGAFTDRNTTDVLTYSATALDGGALPAWLAFDAATRTLSGTRPADDVSIVGVRIVARDPSGAFAFDDIALNLSSSQVIGSSGDDTLSGTSSADFIVGRGGNDTITAGDGNDWIFGEAGDDTLSGEDGDDTLLGGAGADVVSGLHGNDMLIGGTGDDRLDGGVGNDVYEFGIGDGADIIDEEGGNADVIRFGSGITLANLTVTDTVAGLRLQVGSAASGDSILIADSSSRSGEPQPIERVELADGTVLTAAQLQQLVTGNRRPVVQTPLADQEIGRAQNLTYTIPAGAFSDPNDDPLSYFATLADGSALPEWLSFDPATRTLTGSLSQAQGIELAVRITASDPSGLTVSQVLNVTYDPDRIFGTAGDDVLVGSIEDDYVAAGGGNDTINAGAGDDELRGEAGNDVIFGGAGDDWIEGGSGNDVLNGGKGANTYYFSSGFGDDVIEVGDSYSRIIFAPDSGITRASWSFARRDADLVMSVGSDRLTIRNWFRSLLQGEVIAYRNGLPYSYSFSAIDDFVSRGGSAPELVSQLEDLVFQGGESIHYTLPTNAFTDLDSATGAEQLTYSVSPSYPLPAWLTFDPATRTFSGTAPTGERQSVEVSIDATDAAGESFGVWVTFEVHPSLNRLTGTATADQLSGSAGADYIRGGAGDDVITAGSGIDYIYGEAGNDTIGGGADDDRLFGGDGDDSISGGGGYNLIDGGAGDDRLRAGSLGDSISGGRGKDYIEGGGARDNLNGGDGDDEIYGNGGEDSLDGGYGDDKLDGGSERDVLFGGEGNDELSGEAGMDSLVGGLGDDRLHGGAERDTLDGGEGNDTYLGIGATSGFDVIYDTAGEDTLEFVSSENIRLSDLEITRINSDLNISNDQFGIRLQFAFDFTWDFRVENFILYDQGMGYRYTFEQLAGLATGINTGPQVAVTFDPLDAAVGNAFSFLIQTNMFSDAESQFALSYSMTQLDGTALPAWLSFDGVTRTLSGTPSALNAGILGLQLTAQDEAGSTVSTALWIRTGNTAIEGGASSDVLSGTSAGDELIGHGGDDTLLAAAGADLLQGGAGNDVLNGGEGADWMYGGAGNDTYIVDHRLDRIQEDADAGIDSVTSNVDFVLGANIENLTLTGAAVSATGNALDNRLTGTASANRLNGGMGADVLDGGAGADEMIGGDGDDVYIVDDLGDTVKEIAHGGFDTVRSAVTYQLGAELEQLYLDGNAAINGTGNDRLNSLIGNDAANTLNGGRDADSMRGRGGNDTYVVDDIADVVIEEANEGTDLVQSSATFTLGNHVENLTLTGNGIIDGTGNDIDNVLTGNSRDNVLRGGAGNDTLSGGSGNDAMYGGAGNDTFTVAQAGDTVFEDAGAGVDHVQSSVTFTLGANIENLTLTASSSINGTGNELDNIITGNTGANTLSGGAGNDTLNGGSGVDSLSGGLGNDTLIGGAGNDMLAGGDGADIYSYSSGHGADTIDNSSTDTAQDRLHVTNLTRSQVTFSRSGNDLVMTRNGVSTDNVRVTSWFANANLQLDFVQFTDQTLSAAQINAMFGASVVAAETVATYRDSNDIWQGSITRFVDAINHFGGTTHHMVTPWPSAVADHTNDWMSVDSRGRVGTPAENVWREERRTPFVL